MEEGPLLLMKGATFPTNTPLRTTRRSVVLVMYVCMISHIYVRTYICTYVRLCCKYAFVDTYVHIYVYVRMYCKTLLTNAYYSGS